MNKFIYLLVRPDRSKCKSLIINGEMFGSMLELTFRFSSMFVVALLEYFHLIACSV